MNNKTHNILIVGNGAVTSALAKKLSEYEETGKIFITNSDEYKCNYYEYIDIRENDITELLKFALGNDIDLTIPTSELALSSDIVSFFQSNGQNIFGPSEKACKNFINKINCKKFLYKNKAQGTKFAMHSKYNQALDYISKATFPLVISTPESSKSQDSKMLCTTITQAQNFMEKIFLNGETDVLIQEYPYGTNFTVYFITDGYSAVPLTSARNFYFENADKSGKYTDGMGCFAPEYKLTNTVLEKIQSLTENIIANLEKNAESYMGIIGIECVLTDEEHFFVQDLKPFLQNHDARAVLNLLDDNLYEIMTSCINGFFSDEYNEIQTKNSASDSACIKIPPNTRIELVEDDYDIDYNNVKIKNAEIYSDEGLTLVLTKSSATLTGAKNKIAEDINLLKKYNIKYRKDICDRIKQ